MSEIRVDHERLIPLDADAIREWRQNIPEGRTRHDRLEYAVKGPGRRGDPDQTPTPLDPDRGFDLDPLPGGIADPLDARDELERRVLNWVRSAKTPEQKRMLREIVQRRVEFLKATSPVQFGHVDSASLEEQLIATLKAKAAEGVERVYKQQGWVGRQNLDLIGTPRPATGVERLLLPGQAGRDI